MQRIIINLEESDKAWLKRKSRGAGVSMAEVVRQAFQRVRAEEQTFGQLLDSTRGLWRKGDGLRYQQKMRRG